MLHNLAIRPTLLNFLDSNLFQDISNNAFQKMSMKVDVIENEKEFLLNAELPGISKEDISVEFNEGLLSISVESKNMPEPKLGEKFWRIERSFEKKYRSFKFDTAIEESNISCKYENGVLIVSLPKKAIINKTTQIQVN